MSVADKQMLLNKISTALSDKLTATQLTDVMQTISGEAASFEVNHVDQDNSVNQSQELIDAFLSAKEIEGRSKKTTERYRYCINRMLSEVNAPVESINVYHIRKYLIHEKERGIADSTLEGFRSVFSSFFGWLCKENLIKVNPMANIGPVKCEKKVRAPYSDIDIENLKEFCGTDRNRAIVFFLLSTGCRISEMCGLNRDDIDLERRECIVHGKGNKQRAVFLSEVAAMMLKRYLSGREDPTPALFTGKGSDRLTPGGVRFMLKTIARKAGVENCHPHRFRRTLATNLIDRGMPIQDVAFILGHDKLDTTMKYVYMSQENVKSAYRKYA